MYFSAEYVKSGVLSAEQRFFLFFEQKNAVFVILTK